MRTLFKKKRKRHEHTKERFLEICHPDSDCDTDRNRNNTRSYELHVSRKPLNGAFFVVTEDSLSFLWRKVAKEPLPLQPLLHRRDSNAPLVALSLRYAGHQSPRMIFLFLVVGLSIINPVVRCPTERRQNGMRSSGNPVTSFFIDEHIFLFALVQPISSSGTYSQR